jgi:D-arabinose 1-dehydrogenase-like Zn-dependent alcohol dehydrogenase
MTHACYCVTKHNAPLERMDCPTRTERCRGPGCMTAAGVCHSDIHIWEGVYDLGCGNKMTS